MTPRFLLRFESGDRRGEEVPLEPGRTRLGRRPDNEVRLADASVSGEHAELSWTPGGEVELTDRGSTNGTRVQGVRVERCLLDPGAVFTLGNVQMRLVEVPGEAPPAPAEAPPAEGGLVLEEFDAPSVPASSAPTRPASPQAASPQAAGEHSASALADAPASSDVLLERGAAEKGAAEDAVVRVSEEALERAGRRSALGWVLGVALLAAAGWVAWTRFLPAGDEPPAASPVPAVPGNLLAGGGSFETEEGALEPEPECPVAFALEESAARSGRLGLEAALLGGEWSAASSPPLRVRPGRALELTAHVDVEGDAGARAGIRLSSSSGAAAPLTAWSSPVRGSAGGWTEIELAVDVPAAFDRAELLVGAGVLPGEELAGSARFDDAALVARDGPLGTAVAFQEYELGSWGHAAALVRIDRVLLSRVRAATDDSGRAAFFAGAGQGGRVAVAPADDGARWSLPEGGGALALTVEAELAGGGVATTGPAGYRAHTLDFEERADAVLLGSGLDLVRLGFDGPRRTVGRPGERGYELRVDLEPGDAVHVQLSFLEARDEARHRAQLAREAEDAGAPGRALNLWNSLLADFPFEAELVDEAEARAARLFQAGADSVAEVRRELGRARFFGLTDLFRRTRRRALEVAERYADTEVAEGARALAAEIAQEIAAEDAAQEERARARLEAVAGVLRDEGAERLAEHVRRMGGLAGEGR